MALSREQILVTLKDATEGLQMPSESDAPFEPFYWPVATDISLEEAVLQNGGKTAAGAESMEVEEFLEDASTEEDWMDHDEKAAARRFANLIEVVAKCLDEPQVFIFGKRKRDAFLAGRVQGGVAGLKTIVVET